jgi:transketolase
MSHSYLHSEKIKELDEKAFRIRELVIESISEAGSGHPGGSLGMADVFALLFFHTMRHDPKNPEWKDRDRLILSNGHICPALYAAMALAGYFPVEEMKTLRKFGSRLQGHPHREFLPYVETSSGPLGEGLSQAVGMAMADRIDSGRTSQKFFYCLMGDGELNEGQVWEAAMLAGKERLHNLIAIVDRNNIQIDGFTEDVMPLEPLAEKFEAFGWHVVEANGHDFDDLDNCIGQAQAVFAKPTLIIAHTIPGKGVSFMEGRFEWHGAPPGKGPENIVPKKMQKEEALKELKTYYAEKI